MAKVVLGTDTIRIQPNFGMAMVTPPAVMPMHATSHKMHNGRMVCVEGDEKLLRITATYISPPYIIPGLGIVSIGDLGTCKSRKLWDGKPLIVQGGPFVADFRVVSPAMQPTPAGPVSDPMPIYKGTGQFQCPPTNPDENELA